MADLSQKIEGVHNDVVAVYLGLTGAVVELARQAKCETYEDVLNFAHSLTKAKDEEPPKAEPVKEEPPKEEEQEVQEQPVVVKAPKKKVSVEKKKVGRK